MFVLFRLMPGDPVSFLIQPGLTPQERDAQRVAYGFARWESAPGVFKTGSFTVPDPGLYSVTIDVRDPLRVPLLRRQTGLNQERHRVARHQPEEHEHQDEHDDDRDDRLARPLDQERPESPGLPL